MRMTEPIPTFHYLVSRLVQEHPNLAYLHVVEPGLAGNAGIEVQSGEVRPRFRITTSFVLNVPGVSSRTSSSENYGSPSH